MAKIVIAGRADCPYYAKIELLADTLAENLTDFKLHKIVKTVVEWEEWLKETCMERGWQHHKSPLVWRELVERGGKGVLIGGANDFQEYVLHYYDIKSNFTSEDMKAIGEENQETKKEIDAEWRAFQQSSHPIKLCITNANSGAAYALIKASCSGEVFGADTEVSLCLLGSDSDLETLAGTEMEAFDLALPLLRKIHVTSDPHEAFNDCAVIVILDEVTRNEDEERESWLKRNADHFINYAKIINDAAKQDVRVIIAGDGPLNFIASMMVRNAPRVSRQNIVACPRQFENQVKATLAQKLGVNSAGIVNTIIWGNINGAHIIDIEGARVHGYDGAVWGPPSHSIPVQEMIHDKKWLETEFFEVVAKHKVGVETMLNHAKSMSQGAAVVTLLNHWWRGSPEGHAFSLGIYSEGAFGIPEGLIFSCPVNFTCPGYWTVVQDSPLSPESRERIKSIIQEIQSDEKVIYPTEEKSEESEVMTQENEIEKSENEKIFGEESLEKIKEEKEEEKNEDKEDKSSRPVSQAGSSAE